MDGERGVTGDWVLAGERVLTADGIRPARLLITDGVIREVEGGHAGLPTVDAGDGLVLPGIIDLHGDAFERQLQPRPGVQFPMALALLESDRQLLANGITTTFHGLTWSWEPGLRSHDSARAFRAALLALRPRLGCDTRVHLRFETFNLDAVEEALAWIEEGFVDLLAFNDHMVGIAHKAAEPKSAALFAGRAGMAVDAFQALVAKIAGRAAEVPAAMARLAAAARSKSVVLASHDDPDAATRRHYAGLGCRISDFPMSWDAIAEVERDGGAIVLGAPNVLRGGSHIGLISAADVCTPGRRLSLSSDYYYPTLLQAPFVLRATRGLALEDAWSFVSSAPAAAAGLPDRGSIASGQRADLILVDDADPELPAVAATWVAGRLVSRGPGAGVRLT